MIGSFLAVLSSEFKQPKEQGPKLLLHPFDIVEVVYKLGKLLFSESLSITNNLPKSLQQK